MIYEKEETMRALIQTRKKLFIWDILKKLICGLTELSSQSIWTLNEYCHIQNRCALHAAKHFFIKWLTSNENYHWKKFSLFVQTWYLSTELTCKEKLDCIILSIFILKETKLCFDANCLTRQLDDKTEIPWFSLWQ